MFSHLPELIGLCVVALLVFGPKRMVEMGSQLGKTMRELREATKDLNLSTLLQEQETPKPQEPASTTPTMLSHLSQLSQTMGTSAEEPVAHTAEPTPPASTVVESTATTSEPR